MATPVPTFLVWADDVGYRGNDIHLVRSATTKASSEPLEPFLRVFFDDGEIRPLPAGTVVLFDVSVPSPAAVDPADSYVNRYGFDPKFGTGVIELERTPTARVVNNFIITAKATIPGALKNPYESQIRIHIHAGRDQVRVQPNPPRLRKDTALRFSVLAQFSNGSLGDISYHPGLTWQVSSSLVVGPDPHSSVSDKERAFKDGGFISAAPGTTATTGTIKVNLPPSLGGPTSDGDGEATVTIIESWNDLPGLPDGGDPYQAQHIIGPGIAKRDSPNVRNVLFLPEGFQETEETVFEQMADRLALGLRALTAFRPYDILPVNFFRLWVQPYPDALRSGVTELQELFPFLREGNKFRASALPHPTKPGTLLSSDKKKTDEAVADMLSQLAYLVGLPVSLEPQANLAAQIAEWARIYRPGYVRFADTVSTPRQQEVFKRWKTLESRGLTIETDTLFQLATGERPRVDSKPVQRFITPHPLRYTREDLDPLLSKIFVVDENNNRVPIGNDLWVKFSSKDVDLVFFITRGQHYAAANAESGKLSPVDPAQPDKKRLKRRQSAVAMVDSPQPLFEESFDHFFPVTHVEPLIMDATGTTVIVTTRQFGVVAHELAHSMLCGDEYGSEGATASDAEKVDIERWWNLQHVAEVGGTTETGPVQVDKIRWRWPRITAAGVTAAALKPVGTDGKRFSVEMRPPHSGEFAKDDRVRYRPAPLLGRATPGDILQFRQPAALFAVRDRVGNTLELELLEPAPGSFTNDSAAGNVLYKPRRDSAGKDELIIHPAILSLLASSGVLSRRSADCDANAGSDNKFQVPLRPLPSGFRYPATKSSIVGLYDGGNGNRCGIYHATGKCMMRKSDWLRIKRGVESLEITALCHVCRYILVDLVDPRRHDVIDRHFKPVSTRAP